MAGTTGPSSPAGKDKVSRNALKHGLRASKWLSPEEQQDFETLAADLHDEYQPGTATQRILVERIAMCMSKLRRLHTIEDVQFHKARVDGVKFLMDFHPNSTALKIEQTEVGAMPILAVLETLARYQTTLDRQLSKAIGELMVLKANAQLALPTDAVVQG